MLKKVSEFIKKYDLLTPQAKVIVGLSGGADSMALLDILTLLGYQCIAAHCNFHLRSEESNRDATFVKNWCKDVDIPFHSIDFDTSQYAEDKKISIEMAARELRFAWFEIELKNFGADAITLAHHRDDSVETVLLNLVRGTGIKGMTGISPKNGKIIRPLLCVSRDEIIAYLNEREIPFVVDSTNLEDNYKRNFIRLNIIPQLEKLNPSVSDSIQRTAEHLSEAEKIYSAYIEKVKSEVFSDNLIHIPSLKNSLSPSSVLHEILSPYGFNASVIEDVVDNLDATPGKIFYSDNYRLLKDRVHFVLEQIPEGNKTESYFISVDDLEITDPIHLKIGKRKREEVSFTKDQNILFADADKLSFPFTLRKWQNGDWFIPFGMKGKKKLSDYFTDRKFSLCDKEKVWVLFSGNNILWVVGNRSDERFKITDETKNVIVIEFLKC
ncbi:MAG: tRNA lysidine(34) synthetase TilS [Dysgonamonadaceae bacterium]